ncbi:hypothetical protein [Pseudonocardia acidicola]|uniref:WXG100 family type VII secretion target n=1 Tax=Pseudonocardia acidicola TaxID=2724939 RepID=A0ABX1SF37_9PSEU|nr:hypothetical protein [Pseudonocardia acidicola]NMH98986.1 hypothetical protein [Pseudonocardia acidicola]
MSAPGLVVEPVAAPADPTEGARLLDSVADVADALQAGDWAGGLLGLMSGGTEIAAFLQDPLAELIAAGLGWLIEHVPQLREPFDQLAGDRAAIEALALTWRRIAEEAEEAATGLCGAVDADTAPWRGPAIEAYRPVGYRLATTGSVAAGAAGVAAVIVEKAGHLVLAVRAVVRDELAKAAADLIATFLRSLVLVGTGVGVVALAGLLVQRALSWAGRLLEWVRRVGEALTVLRGLMDRLVPALRPGPGPMAGPRIPGVPRPPRFPAAAPRDPDGMRPPAGRGGGPGPVDAGWPLAVEVGKEDHQEPPVTT